MEWIGLMVCFVCNLAICRMIRYSGLPCRKSDCLSKSLCFGYTLSVNMAVFGKVFVSGVLCL